MSVKTKEEHLRHLIATYAMRAGEEVKRGLPTIIREAYRSQCWKDATKSNGSKFTSLTDWLVTAPPPGCGIGCTPDAITYDEVMVACERFDKEVAKILANDKPNGINGRPKKTVPYGTVLKTGGTMLRSTLAARLAQEYPDHYQKFLDGKYKSIRATAEAAKLVNPGNNPLARLKSFWKRASQKQRTSFLEWIKENDQ